MIENLNALSFKNYGKIIHAGFSAACNLLESKIYSVREQEIRSMSLDRLVCAKTSPVLLDIVDGIAILYIYDACGNSVRTFLLDKTAWVDEGIYYGVTALYGSCIIKSACREGASFEERQAPCKLSAAGIYPQFELNKVHTLFYQEKERGFIFKGEKHDFWELTYVDTGFLNSIVDGKGYKLAQGDMLFYGRNQHHTQWCEAGTSVCFVTVTFDMNFAEGPFLTDRKFSTNAAIRELMEKLLLEQEHNLNYADDLILCYLKEIIIRLVRSEELENTIKQQDTQVKHKIENSMVARCIDYIQKNIGTKLTVPEIARNIPISQSYLSSIFKKHMTMTLVDYINHYRLEKSKDLIRTSEYSFTQISDLLGYTSVHYFSNQFKARYGVSPKEYAKSIRQ